MTTRKPTVSGSQQKVPLRLPKGGSQLSREAVRSGWRFLFFTVLTSAVIGLLFRIIFAPEFVVQRVREAIDRNINSQAIQIEFSAASVELARGSIPEIAIVLSNVRLSPASGIVAHSRSSQAACASEPVFQKLHLSEVRLPLRLTALLGGELIPSFLFVKKAVLDLQTQTSTRASCSTNALGTLSPARLVESTTSDSVAGIHKSVNGGKVEKIDIVFPWWNESHLGTLNRYIPQLEITELVVHLVSPPVASSKQPQVTLGVGGERSAWGLVEQLHLAYHPTLQAIQGSAHLRLAPEILFGEQFPPINLELRVTAQTVELSAKVEHSEGVMEGYATLKPLITGDLEIDAKASVSEIPLSMVAPILLKAGIMHGYFAPRFFWLGCSLALKTTVARLSTGVPITLEHCSIDGNDSTVQVESAERHANGSWKPFTVEIRDLDLKRVLEAFAAKGPDGVASDFGKITGVLEVRAPDQASFSGALIGAQVHFSSRNLRAVQQLSKASLKAEIDGARMSGVIDQIDLKNGRFDGALKFVSDRQGREGRIDIKLSDLALDPYVQRVLVNGELSSLSGQGRAVLTEGRISSVVGKWKMKEIKAQDVAVLDSHFETRYEGGDIEVDFESPQLSIREEASVWKDWQSLFFNHRFPGDWVRFNDVGIKGSLSDLRGVIWSRAFAQLENGKIEVTSSGSLNRQQQLAGWINLDYPKIKRLKWVLGGESTLPVLTEDSKTLHELLQNGSVDDRTLGLPPASGTTNDDGVYRHHDSKYSGQNQDKSQAGIVEKTGQEIREFGEKVLKRARRIVPSQESSSEGRPDDPQPKSDR